MFDNGHQHIGNDGNIDLCFNYVEAMFPKAFDFEMCFVQQFALFSK